MRKSLTKRVRITKRGKILRRVMGLDHFRTRQSPRGLARKQGEFPLAYPKKKLLNY